MRSVLILFALAALIGVVGAQAGPVLPQQHDGRLVHPGSPLDTVMSSEHNDIAWLQTYPIDLTGLPGWEIFKAPGFEKDGIVVPVSHLAGQRTISQDDNLTMLDSGVLTTFTKF